MGKKKRTIIDGREPQRIRFPFVVLVRMFLIGTVAVAAAGWAIWRHYTVPRMPMVVPVAPSATEIEIEPAP